MNTLDLLPRSSETKDLTIQKQENGYITEESDGGIELRYAPSVSSDVAFLNAKTSLIRISQAL